MSVGQDELPSDKDIRISYHVTLQREHEVTVCPDPLPFRPYTIEVSSIL